MPVYESSLTQRRKAAKRYLVSTSFLCAFAPLRERNSLSSEELDGISALLVGLALINALEGIWRKMVAIQPAGPELFEPSAFDCDDRLTHPQKLLDISTRGLETWTGTDTKLNVSSSADGRTWNTTTFNQTSKLAPAIAVGTF